jgi:nucleoside-diphosphate-sugar epimerase
VGDCAAVVHVALAGGTPRQIYQAERALIENAVTHSPPGAIIIYFSTQSVYRDPRPGRLLRWRSAYGQIKLASEQLVQRLCRREHKPCYVLRLGHVCGELQNITALLRQRVRDGQVYLPPAETISNTVYTATVADAVLKIMAGQESPGVYDLMSHPQWTWSQVYAHEAENLAVPLRAVRLAPPPPRGSLRGACVQTARRMAGRLGRIPLIKDLLRQAVSNFSADWNLRSQAEWNRARAALEIAQLNPPLIMDESHTWRPLGRRFLKTLAPTAELLGAPAYQIPPLNTARSWPGDLPQAQD